MQVFLPLCIIRNRNGWYHIKLFYMMTSKKMIMMIALLGIVMITACNNDDELNPEVGTYYEENPTTLEGKWHLTKAFYGFSGFSEINPGDVTVIFNSNHTMQVINKTEGKERKHFMNSGVYPYEIVESTKNGYDEITYTTINIKGEKCTYWFKNGMMTLDFGIAYDAPGYFFKKIRITYD